MFNLCHRKSDFHPNLLNKSLSFLSKSQPVLGGAKDLYASNAGLVNRRGISVGHREISLCLEDE